MKLSLFEVYRYTLPSRNGIFVRLRNEIGQEGVGEVAPLPGRSKETLEEALTAVNDGLIWVTFVKGFTVREASIKGGFNNAMRNARCVGRGV